MFSFPAPRVDSTTGMTIIMHPDTTLHHEHKLYTSFTISTANNEQQLPSGGVEVFKDNEAYSLYTVVDETALYMIQFCEIWANKKNGYILCNTLCPSFVNLSLRISAERYSKWPLWDLKRQQTTHLSCVLESEFWFTCKLLDKLGSQQPRHPSTRSCSDPWPNRSHYYVFQVSSKELGMGQCNAMTDTCTTSERRTQKVPIAASVLLLLLKVFPGT